MIIPKRYILNPSISKLLQSIEASKAVIDSLTINKKIELNIRRHSTLNSALYSARIEGNKLTPEDIEVEDDKDREKIEVFNLLEALEKIAYKRKTHLDLAYILELHKTAMKGISDDAGKFRKEVSAIFNIAGVAVYLPPPPGHIHDLLIKLLDYVNQSADEFIPIKASLAHYTFEKIRLRID